MNVENLLELVMQFLNDARVWTIMALIVVDLVTGVAAALKSGKFDWQALGDFYTTNVLPFVASYLPVYLIFQFAGAYIGEYVSEGILIALWAPIPAALLGSIASNLKELGVDYTPPDAADPYSHSTAQ